MKAWFLERFPLINLISGFFMYLLPKSLLILWYYPVGPTAFPWSWEDAAACLVPALQLLLLRIFDEHKDFESDKIFNPDRVLQKGLIKLSDLRALGWICVALQLICFFAIHPSQEAMMAFAGMWAWTLLMWKEFFVKAWLKKHFLCYSLLHVVISPWILLACAMMAKTPSELLPDLLLIGFVTSWIYETSRKTKAPPEETGDTSYSKMWGLRTCAWVISFQGIISLCLAADLFQKVSLLHIVQICIFILVLLLHLGSIMKFAERPTPKGRKSNEGTSALIGFVIFVIPFISAIQMSFF
jgi:hypothetical protein